jgi:transcriptional regulator with XRE-family HTH domain
MVRRNELAEEIDRFIGTRIQELRLISGLSRNQVAAKIGITHQQLQKYEKGTNRLTAGRLYMIAKVFHKTVSYFYDQIPGENVVPTIHQRMCLEVSRNFMRIKSSANQRAINALIRTLADNQEEK